jgi:hypothetical protein
VWNNGIQARIATVVDRSSRHLACIIAEEVLEGTHGCCIAGSHTAQSRFDLPRAPDQDLGLKGSCDYAQDRQLLQDSME